MNIRKVEHTITAITLPELDRVSCNAPEVPELALLRRAAAGRAAAALLGLGRGAAATRPQLPVLSKRIHTGTPIQFPTGRVAPG